MSHLTYTRRGGKMRKTKKERLVAAGWTVGSNREFLGLSEAEEALIELKVSLSRLLRIQRRRRRLSQTEVAKRLRSSQSRIAKMEAADPSVSMDLLVRSLLALGATSGDLARAISLQAMESLQSTTARRRIQRMPLWEINRIVGKARKERGNVVPVEVYTPERRAEFLLTNATDAADSDRARSEVRKLGLDPAKIKHRKPSKR